MLERKELNKQLDTLIANGKNLQTAQRMNLELSEEKNQKLTTLFKILDGMPDYDLDAQVSTLLGAACNVSFMENPYGRKISFNPPQSNENINGYIDILTNEFGLSSVKQSIYLSNKIERGIVFSNTADEFVDTVHIVIKQRIIALLQPFYKLRNFMDTRIDDELRKIVLLETLLFSLVLKKDADNLKNVIELLKPNINNIHNQNDESLLILASSKGNATIVKTLLEAKADVTAKDKQGRTSIWEAACKGDANSLMILIENKADVENKDEKNQSPLWIAACNGNSHAVKILIDAKADVNARDKNGITPLWIALSNDMGGPQLVKTLLETKADIEAKNEEGITPLWVAAFTGDAASMRVLIEAKADVDAKDKEDRTPLLIAAFKGYIFPVRELISAKANVETKDKQGRTPLHMAEISGNTNCIILIKAAIAKNHSWFDRFFECNKSISAKHQDSVPKKNKSVKTSI